MKFYSVRFLFYFSILLSTNSCSLCPETASAGDDVAYNSLLCPSPGGYFRHMDIFKVFYTVKIDHLDSAVAGVDSDQIRVNVVNQSNQLIYPLRYWRWWENYGNSSSEDILSARLSIAPPEQEIEWYNRDNYSNYLTNLRFEIGEEVVDQKTNRYLIFEVVSPFEVFYFEAESREDFYSKRNQYEKGKAEWKSNVIFNSLTNYATSFSFRLTIGNQVYNGHSYLHYDFTDLSLKGKTQKMTRDKNKPLPFPPGDFYSYPDYPTVNVLDSYASNEYFLLDFREMTPASALK